MDRFVINDALVSLRAALSYPREVSHLPKLVELAWHLRQRNTHEALQLVAEAEQLIQQTPAPSTPHEFQARIQLILGEAKWLFAELDAATQITQAAVQNFTQQNDGCGLADAHWLLAMIAIDQGDHAQADKELETATHLAKLAGDVQRSDLAQAALARWAVMRNPTSAKQRWGQHFPENHPTLPPTLACWVLDYHSLAAAQISDFGRSIAYGIQTWQAALASGQLRVAMITCTNIGEDFSRLNDHQSALEWMQRGLELAAPTGWPRNIGACLMHTAEAMRVLGQHHAAQSLLEQALQTLAPLSNARSYAICLQYMGNLALDQHDHARALSTFRQLEQRANALEQADFKIDSQRGQAHALFHLGQTQAGLDAAHAALLIAQKQGDTFRQIQALQALYTIHATSTDPAAMPHTALAWLQQAQQVAASIEGYALPSEILDALAHEFAKIGAFDKAYETALQAQANWKKTHNQNTASLAIALQIKNQTEYAQRETEHLRQLADVEAKRAQAAQQTSTMLEHLSIVGQEITTHLNEAAVFQALDRHVHDLMEISSLAIYLLEADEQALFRAFCRDGENLLPTTHIAMNDPSAHSARCARERRELTIRHPSAAEINNLFPGSLPTLSSLFAPLMIDDHLLGVISVQAMSANAYGERDWLIFRTLCAYSAIALDNAQAYRKLQQAQTQLVEQEKMAALGSLVAGVSHELNTPIGNSLVIASTLHAKGKTIREQVNGPGMKRSDLINFIEDTQHASTLIMRGLHNAVDLLNSFKQVAIDRTTAQRRPFNLQQTCGEIVATMMNQIKKSGHVFTLDIAPEIQLHSYPGPLGQVLTNLINNALLHAFEGRNNGQIRLCASLNGTEQICLRFQDNGTGIPEQHIHHIFDPFFTTKLGRGGNGLGLSISYNIVTSLLMGSIKVQSSMGNGTTFILELPLVAPDKTEPMPHQQNQKNTLRETLPKQTTTEWH